MLSKYLKLYKNRKRSNEFEQDYPAFLSIITSLIRAGIHPLDAIIQTENLFPVQSEIYFQIQKIKSNLEQGDPENTAIMKFCEDLNFNDALSFKLAVVLAKNEGASLSKILYRLSRVTRNRQSFRRKIKSNLATQRLSSIGIILCSICITTSQIIANRDSIVMLKDNEIAILIFGIGLFMQFIGLILLFRIGLNLESKGA
jgi:tight adherence protein B